VWGKWGGHGGSGGGVWGRVITDKCPRDELLNAFRIHKVKKRGRGDGKVRKTRGNIKRV